MLQFCYFMHKRKLFFFLFMRILSHNDFYQLFAPCINGRMQYIWKLSADFLSRGLYP